MSEVKKWERIILDQTMKADDKNNSVKELADKDELVQDDFSDSDTEKLYDKREIILKGNDADPLTDEIEECQELIGKKLYEVLNVDNEFKEMDFVEAPQNQILKFIQDITRSKREYLAIKTRIKADQKHYLSLLKADLHEREEIKSIKTQKERGLAVDKIIIEDYNLKFDDYINKLSERIDTCTDEVYLAKEIFKLRTLV